jgi:hypothetical protein
MIEFFLLLGFIVGLLLITSRGAKSMPSRCDLNLDDKKHHWLIRFDNGDRKGYLVCKVCGKIPGEE